MIRVIRKYEALRGDLKLTIPAPDCLKSVSTRDAFEKVVMHIAAKLAPDLALTLDGDEKGERGDMRTDTMIVCANGLTCVVPLRFTRKLVWIDNQPFFIGHEDGVEVMASAILDELERIEWRAMR